MLQHQAADDLTLIIKEKNHSPLKKKKKRLHGIRLKVFCKCFQ